MIKIFPLSQIIENKGDINRIYYQLSQNFVGLNLTDLIGDFVYFDSGKKAIQAIIEHLQLTRFDEVMITTSTDSSFVSTCVSATIFNYCKISRVLTDKTKAIVVIHNFCFPHPDIDKLKEMADERGICLIEDCISAFDSYNQNNIRLGSVGDFAVYSLPKIFPINYGGILTSKKTKLAGINDNNLANFVRKWSPALPELKKRRRELYSYLHDRISNPIYNISSDVNPYMFGFLSDYYEDIMSDFSSEIEFGKTHVKNEIHIPLNPFFDENNFGTLNDFISKINYGAENVRQLQFS